jgi:hypothetical protein
MSTQDIYAWIQIILQVIVGGGLALYIGVLKRAVDTQKATIEAQAEHLKAQTTVLQDFERLNKAMKLAIDTLNAPAILEHGEAYKALVDKTTALILEDQARQQAHITEFMGDLHSRTVSGYVGLIGEMLPFIPKDRRMALINSAALNHPYKDTLQELAEAASDPYGPLLTGVVVRAGGTGLSSFSMAGGRVTISESILPLNEPQEGTPSPN